MSGGREYFVLFLTHTAVLHSHNAVNVFVTVVNNICKEHFQGLGETDNMQQYIFWEAHLSPEHFNVGGFRISVGYVRF